MNKRPNIRKFSRRSGVPLALVVIVILALFQLNHERVQAFGSGPLDPTFGVGGMVSTDIGASTDLGQAMVLQPDGKIIVSGSALTAAASFNFALVRYNTDGTLDNTFGTGGRVTTDFAGGRDQTFAVAVQTDGKILAAGTANAGGGTGNDFALTRYDASGVLDSSFGTGGKVTTSLSPSDDEIYAIALQTDGKIVAVGEAALFNVNSNLGLVRYNTNGSLDTGFGTGGIVTTDFFGSQDRGRAIAVLPSGKIVVAGSAMLNASTIEFALAQYDNSGGLDSSFGTGGRVTTTLGNTDFARALVVQTDGKIVVGGNSINSMNSFTNQDFALARYQPNGSLDPTFGNGGRVLTHFFGGSGESIQALALQSDGKIVAAGLTGGDLSFGSTRQDFALARYNSDGSLAGKLRTNFFSLDDGAEAVCIQADGKIVAAGTADSLGGAGKNFAVARYVNIATPVTHAPPGDFDGDGKTDLSVFRPNGGIWYTINSSDGSFHFSFMGTSPIHLAPGDYDGDGKADLAFVSNGSQWTIRGSHGVFMTYSFGTGTDRPIPADYDGDGRTEAADFRPNGALWLNLSEDGTGNRATTWGLSTDVAVPGDYDGDGQTDLAVFRPSNGAWYVLRSSDGNYTGTAWGLSTDHPVPGDYDGDQKTDLAVWRPSTGGWYVLRSSDGTFTGVAFGNESFGDIPVPGDFDGDHKTDIAVWRAGTWYWLWSSDGSFHAQMFGQAGDIPIPATYIP